MAIKESGKKIILIIIIANCILIAMAICGKILSIFNYEDHLDDAVITVDDNDITLREFGYYIYEVEEFVQRQALLYDPENPRHWWNTHFSAGMDSQFVCDYAKKVALNVCILEEVYYNKAISEGIVLENYEEQQAADEARKVFEGLGTEVIARTGLNENIFINMRRKHALASKYAESLSGSLNFSGYSGDAKELLNWDGAYYQEKILPEHAVDTNDKILSRITLGKITVNY